MVIDLDRGFPAVCVASLLLHMWFEHFGFDWVAMLDLD